MIFNSQIHITGPPAEFRSKVEKEEASIFFDVVSYTFTYSTWSLAVFPTIYFYEEDSDMVPMQLSSDPQSQPTDIENTSSITDVDEITSESLKIESPIKAESGEFPNGNTPIAMDNEPVRHNLMNILSGKQISKRNQKARKTKQQNEEILAEIPPELSHVESEISDVVSEDPDCSVNSVTDSQMNYINNETKVIELENKIYGERNLKSISARDFLKSKNEAKKPIDIPESVLPIDNSSDEVVHIDCDADDIIEIISDPDQKNRELENKVYGVSTKSTSVKDLFGAFKPKISENPSLPVKLSINSSTLKEITKSHSPMSILQRMPGKRKDRKDHFVRLKISPNKLLEIQKAIDNPFFTKGTNQNSKQTFARDESTPKAPKKMGAKSAFQSMMAHSKANTPKLTSLQKLKELYPAPLSREQFHVTSEKSTQPVNDNLLSSLLLKEPRKSVDTLIEENGADSYDFGLSTVKSTSTKRPNDKVCVQYRGDTGYLEAVVPKLFQNPAFRRIYDDFIKDSNIVKKVHGPSLLWTDFFKPVKAEHLLIPAERKHRIHSWITNSFNRLKSQALSTPRNVQIRQKKRNMRNNSSFDDFIVADDVYDLDEATEEEIFVPVLIIQGSRGVGKSASVYAALEEMQGYVYEVNSGQQRSRRDLYSTLKELCTTQLVHSNSLDGGMNSKKNDFQKGIILLDDTDVLFEQDRTFWTVVQDLINISRRPIVITCTDIANIPKNILEYTREDNAIIQIDNPVDLQTQEEYVNYLWLCAYSQGYDVSKKILTDIIKSTASETTFDLRRSLIELQMLCRSKIKTENNTIIQISAEQETESISVEVTTSLEAVVQKLEQLSHSDIIDSNTTSSLISHVQENELLDFYIIDESKLLKQKTLPFELNIGSLLKDSLEACEVESTPSKSFNTVRTSITRFAGSRTKKLPKYILEGNPVITRRTTRSFMSGTSSFDGGTDDSYNTNSPSPMPNESYEWRNDSVGISDSSIFNYLSPTPYVLELAPFNRNWATFQITLDAKEIETLAEHNVSVKRFIGWRQFQGNTSDVVDTFNVHI